MLICACSMILFAAAVWYIFKDSFVEANYAVCMRVVKRIARLAPLFT